MSEPGGRALKREGVRWRAIGAAWVGGCVAAAVPAVAGLRPPPNTLPNTVAVVLTCGVDDGSKTRDCRPLAGRPSREEAAVLSDVAARPAYLPGARPGSSVLTIVRRKPGAPDTPLAPAEAGPLGGNAKVIHDAAWDIMPTDRLIGYWPDAAMRKRVTGQATAVCSVTAEGALVGCWISAVDPPGEAFDLATLLLTTVLKMKPLTRSGAPVDGGVYVLTSHFENEGRRAALRLDAP